MTKVLIAIQADIEKLKARMAPLLQSYFDANRDLEKTEAKRKIEQSDYWKNILALREAYNVCGGDFDLEWGIDDFIGEMSDL